MSSEHKCHFPFDGPWTCDSGARYEVHLHLECQAPGHRHAVSMRSTIECCATHCDAAKRFILSPVNREKITVGLMEQNGFPEPNWLTARVEFKPIPVPVEIVSGVVRCDREDCQRIAKYQIVVGVPELGGGRVMEAPSGLYVCEVHRTNTRVKHITGDEDVRKALYEALQKSGMMVPDMTKARIRFESLEIATPVGG